MYLEAIGLKPFTEAISPTLEGAGLLSKTTPLELQPHKVRVIAKILNICVILELEFMMFQRKNKLSELLDEYPMLLLAGEAGVALLILVGIVVWTMMGRKDK
jgi:hypothetical protein